MKMKIKLLHNPTIEGNLEICFNELMDKSEDTSLQNNNNLHSSIGEVLIKSTGITYQIQMSLIADKRAWCDETGINISEFTKFH